jgi:hypothetical protein
MSTKQAEKTAGEIMLRVRHAAHLIAAARKQAVSQYDADLRRLSDLDMQLTTPEAISQPELFSVEKVITPELQELLDAPLAKYI